MKQVTEADLKFILTGEQARTLSVITVSETLNNLNQLMLATAESIYPSSKCELKITATKEGSFVIDLQMISSVAVTLLTPANLETAKNVLETVVAFFDIKKHIGNKKPKDIFISKDKTEIINSNNEKKDFSPTGQYFFSSPTFEYHITQIVQQANNEDVVSGIELIDPNNNMPSFTADSLTLKNMTLPVIEEKKNIQEIISIDTLYVKQPDLMGNAKWTFQKDRKIEAAILDEQWLKEYRDYKHTIVPKMQLKVELKTYLEIGDDGLPIIGKSTYEIVKVLEVIYPNEYTQMEL